MRVLVACATMGRLSSRAAGTLIGRAWAARGAQVAVIAMSASELAVGSPVVDLRLGLPEAVPDGAIGVVDATELARPLTGLRGVAAERGRAEGWELADVLAEDARLAAWASQQWPGQLDAATLPGGGAHMGAGLPVLAAGGRLMTESGLCAEIEGLANTVQRADLVVTGSDVFDFGSFGGEVVAELLAAATAAARPIIVLTGTNYVSARELRAAGIEAVYASRAGASDEPITEGELATLADRVAASWTST